MRSQQDKFIEQQTLRKMIMRKKQFLNEITANKQVGKQNSIQLNKNSNIQSEKLTSLTSKSYLQYGNFQSTIQQKSLETLPLFRRKIITIQPNFPKLTKKQPTLDPYTPLSVDQFQKEFKKIVTEEQLLEKSKYFQSVVSTHRSTSQREKR